MSIKINAVYMLLLPLETTLWSRSRLNFDENFQFYAEIERVVKIFDIFNK